MKNVTMTSTINRIKNAYDAKRNLPVGADGQAVLVSATEYALVEIAAWQQSEIAALKTQVLQSQEKVANILETTTGTIDNLKGIAEIQTARVDRLEAQVKRLESRNGPVVADGSNLGRSKLFKT